MLDSAVKDDNFKKMKPKHYNPSNNSEITRNENEGERVVSSYCGPSVTAPPDSNDPDAQEVTTDYDDSKGIIIFKIIT